MANEFWTGKRKKFWTIGAILIGLTAAGVVIAYFSVMSKESKNAPRAAEKGELAAYLSDEFKAAGREGARLDQKFPVTDPGPDLHAWESQLPHAAPQLLDGPAGILQGHRAQSAEPIRPLRHQSGQEVVLRAGEHRRAAGRCVMAERDRDRRDHLQRHTFGVHVGQPPAGGPAAAVDVPVRPAAHQDARVRLTALLHGWPVRPGRYGREIRQRRRDGMGVQVDEPHNQRCLGTTGP